MNVKFDSNQSRAAKRQNCQKFLIASARLKLHLGFGESEINSPEKNEFFSFESFLMLIRPVSLFQKPLRRGGGLVWEWAKNLETEMDKFLSKWRTEVCGWLNCIRHITIAVVSRSISSAQWRIEDWYLFLVEIIACCYQLCAVLSADPRSAILSQKYLTGVCLCLRERERGRQSDSQGGSQYHQERWHKCCI